MNLLRSYVFLASIFLFSSILECYGSSSLHPIKKLGLNLTFSEQPGNLEILKAASSIEEIGESIFKHIYSRPITDVLLEIQEKYGKVELDDILFVQVYQHILGGIQQPFLLSGSTDTQLMGDLVSKKIVYMLPEIEVFDLMLVKLPLELIDELPLDNLGLWLIHTDGDVWVGMGSESPFQGTLSTWAKRLKTGLQKRLMSLPKDIHSAMFETSDLFNTINLSTADGKIIAVKVEE